MTSVLTPLTPPPPSLSPRIHIPYHIYRHPTAILLELCTCMRELNQFLPLVIKQGLYKEHLLQTKLVSLFTKYGSLEDAVKVFESIEDKVDPLYHTMLKGFVQKSNLDESLRFFCRMKNDGVGHVVYNFTYLLKSCADSYDVRRGKEIHAQLVVHGFWSDVFAMTSLMNLYAKCKMVDDAWKLFDRMPVRDLVCWNTVISCFSQNGMPKRALDLVVRMQKEGLCPDYVTIVSVLPACSDIKDLNLGKSIHGYVLRRGLERYVNVNTALLDMYAKSGLVKTARTIFDDISDKTVVSWNSMIDGYAQNGDSEQALALFQQMVDLGLKPTNVTVMSALHACADLSDLERGRFVHELAIQSRHDSDVNVSNSLISMYCKCKRLDIASQLFYELEARTLVSWNAMILGYAQNGHATKAIDLFCEMRKERVKPDSFTLVSVATAVSETSVLRHAKWIHGIAIRTLLDRNVFVATALVDAYAKCGAVRKARSLFDRMSEQHVTTWNAMIDGYGTHGYGEEALQLFDEMRGRKEKTNPNDVTFLCVISACSHSGLVEEGRRCYEIMKEEYGIEPTMEHYGAMVDLLGRAGRLDEAWEFIRNMPVEPGLNVYGAMLGACRIHKNVDLGERVADRLFREEPDEGGYHVLLANMYAIASMWDKVASVRRLMEKKGIKKTPGISSVDLKNEVHTFYSGSTKHPRSREIYGYLEKLIERIKREGYVPDMSSIHDVEDDVQEQLLSTHSEKLAISFALISTSPGTTIHVRKNLRVCGDCHSATKFISLVTKREIVVRDMHRFHHFKDGMCSCGDYW